MSIFSGFSLSATARRYSLPSIADLSQGMGAGGGTATMLGPITVTNDVTAGGKSVQNNVHGGVQTGGGQTGKPA